MKLNLIYQFYVKINLSANDYFSDIINGISPEYPNIVSKPRTLFMPIEHSDVEIVAKNGLLTMDKELHGIHHPHYVIQELVVSFDVSGNDYSEVKDHIIDKFGKQATMYQLIEEGRLKDPV